MGCSPAIGGAPIFAPGSVGVPIFPSQPQQTIRPTAGLPQPSPLSMPPQRGPQIAGEARPKIRMQAPEETPPAPPQRLMLPLPEQLGIAMPQATATVPAPMVIDWNVAKQRLERLAALGFHTDRLARGGFRVAVLLPAGPGTHHIEAEAGSEAAAVAFALDRAEEWAARK